MKKQFFTLGFILLSIAAIAQTSTNKNNLNIGAGTQYYKGDLGNSFLDFQEEWYGVVRIAYSRYLNRSLDAQAIVTHGDIGRCFEGPFDPENRPLMLNSRFTALGFDLKYKFANGYILKEAARISPYVYAGASACDHRDLWTNEPRVNEGFYTAINGGLGASFYLTKRFQLNYNLGLGYFTSDAMDFISEGSNDMYLQNTISVGYDF